MAQETLTLQAERNERSRYALQQLKELNYRAQWFIRLGTAKGYRPDGPFEKFEAATVEMLSLLGSWIASEQFVNASWKDSEGRLQEGGFLGFNFDIAPQRFSLALEVVPQHDIMNGMESITAEQIVDLQASQPGAAVLPFSFGRKKPEVKPVERIKAIVDHFMPGIVTPFRPPLGP